jgi:hypothetical protein
MAKNKAKKKYEDMNREERRLHILKRNQEDIDSLKRWRDERREVIMDDVSGIMEGGSNYRVGPKGHPDTKIFPNTPEGKKQARAYEELMVGEDGKHYYGGEWEEAIDSDPTARPYHRDITDIVKGVEEDVREHEDEKSKIGQWRAGREEGEERIIKKEDRAKEIREQITGAKDYIVDYFKKNFEEGGKITGPSHEDGGIDINVEGGEMIVNESVNGAATKHSKGLKALNENPDGYEIIPIQDSRKRRT